MQGSTALPPAADSIDARAPEALLPLASARAWRRVASAAEELLAAGTVTRSAAAVDVRLCRCIALLRMRSPEEAKLELAAVETAAQSAGTAAPFAAQLLAVRAATAAGDCSGDALIDRLTALKTTLEQRITALSSHDEALSSSSSSSSSCDLSLVQALQWRRRVCSGLASALQEAGKWRAALSALQSLDDELRRSSSSSSSSSSSGAAPAAISATALHTARTELQSRIGRVFLQMGDLQHAALFFERAAREAACARASIASTSSSSSSSSSSTSSSSGSATAAAAGARLQAQIMVNAGLLAFGCSDYNGAAALFEEAAAVVQSVQQQQQQQQPDSEAAAEATGIELEGGAALCAAAVNNSAIAALYLCDLRRALAALEGAVKCDPVANMRETAVFNLCTLYDLSSDPAGSSRRKAVLQRLAQRYSLDDLDPAAFRM
jgi:trimeric autotransporter adhesin